MPDSRGDGQHSHSRMNIDQHIGERHSVLYDMQQVMADLSAKTRGDAPARSFVEHENILASPRETCSEVCDQRALSDTSTPRCECNNPQLLTGEKTSQTCGLICVEFSHDARPPP